MKKTFILTILCFSLGLVFVSAPNRAFACGLTGQPKCPVQNTDKTGTGTQNTDPISSGAQNNDKPGSTVPNQNNDPCRFNYTGTQICNPISGATDAKQLLVKIVKYILDVIALIAVTVIVISGFRMVISQGNESQVKGAKSAITWAIIGLAVSVLAYSIIAIVDRALTSK